MFSITLANNLANRHQLAQQFYELCRHRLVAFLVLGKDGPAINDYVQNTAMPANQLHVCLKRLFNRFRQTGG